MSFIQKWAAVFFLGCQCLFIGCTGTVTIPPSPTVVDPTVTPIPTIPSVTATFTISVGFSNITTVRVINPNGNIGVNVVQTISNVQITGTKSTDGPAGQAATDRLTNIKILAAPLAQIPTTLQIQANIPLSTVNTHDRVDFIISIPAGANLELTTQNGLITVTDNTGIVVARNNNAAIAVANNVGNVDVSTANGQVVLSNIVGSVTATTTNAPITVQAAITIAQAITVTTSNGTIAIQVPFNTSANLFLSSNNGIVNADFTGFKVTNPRITTTSVFATLGGGGADIVASTSNATLTFAGTNLLQ
jgi:hypothetical protein